MSVTEEARRQVVEAGATRELALRMKARFGWKLSDTAAVSRVDEMLSSGNTRRLPADALPDVLWVTGRRDFLQMLKAEWDDVQDALDVEAEACEVKRQRMRTVPARKRGAA